MRLFKLINFKTENNGRTDSNKQVFQFPQGLLKGTLRCLRVAGVSARNPAKTKILSQSVVEKTPIGFNMASFPADLDK
jgi:hypothetical protein